MLNGICLLALDMSVNALRENYSYNYEHQLKKLCDLKYNKCVTIFAVNFVIKVEIRKIDCILFG